MLRSEDLPERFQYLVRNNATVCAAWTLARRDNWTLEKFYECCADHLAAQNELFINRIVEAESRRPFVLDVDGDVRLNLRMLCGVARDS